MFAPSLQHIKTYTYCYFNIVRFSSSKLKVVFKFNTIPHEELQQVLAEAADAIPDAVVAIYQFWRSHGQPTA